MLTRLHAIVLVCSCQEVTDHSQARQPHPLCTQGNRTGDLGRVRPADLRGCYALGACQESPVPKATQTWYLGFGELGIQNIPALVALD